MVRPYLVPFDCWSLWDFGLDEVVLAQLVSYRDAPDGLLTLLDRCIGDQQDSVKPYDLAIALKFIAASAPELSDESRYVRLRTLTRG